MAATGEQRIPVPGEHRAASAATATPTKADPAHQVATENVGSLTDTDASNGYMMLRHWRSLSDPGLTRLDRASYALRVNSARFERGEISGDVWANNVRLIIGNHYG